jgi:hypothetical protein
MNGETKTGVIILTMEDSDDTIECLASLYRMKRDDFAVILVANGSSRRCITRIHDRFPDIHVIRNSENLGCAGGRNAGIRAAVDELGCTHVLLLDNDVVVAPDILEHLLCAFSGAPGIAAVGAKIYSYARPNTIDHVGGTVDPVTGLSAHSGYSEEDRGQYEIPRDCDYATGAVFFTSAETLGRVGLFDPTYLYYFEEADWCARARSLGMKILVNPKAKAWHKVGCGVGALWTLYAGFRNRGLYIWKNHAENFDRFAEAYAADIIRLLNKFESRKEYAKIIAMLMGFDDFCGGNFGVGRIDEVRSINPAFAPPLKTRVRVRLLTAFAQNAPRILQRRIIRRVRRGMRRWPVWAAGNAPRRQVGEKAAVNA